MAPPKLPFSSSYRAPLAEALVLCDLAKGWEEAPRRKPLPRRAGARFTVQLCRSNCGGWPLVQVSPMPLALWNFTWPNPGAPPSAPVV